MMPSLRHQAAVAMLRLFRVRRSGAPDLMPAKLAARDARAGDGAPSPRAVRGISVERASHGGWTTWRLFPEDAAARSGHVVVAVHGGGYIQEIQDSHYRAYADLVKRSGATIEVPIYPLAPQGTAEAVVPVIADLISECVARVGADNVGVLGDSAGAGLGFAAVQELVRRRTSVPSRLVLVSPWLDVTLSDPRSRTIDDPMLNIDGLVEAGRLWAGQLDPRDWRVSPLFGSMEGIPTTAVFAGTLDCLVPDSWRLRDRAKQEHLDITFDIQPGLIHAWAGFTILPEYQRTAPAIVRALVGADQRSA